MLGDSEAIATVAVKDLNAAKKFYADTLGLKAKPSTETEVLNFKAGRGTLLVYRSQFAGTNKATTVTWEVADVPALARELKTRGVTFEHYDMPGMKLEGDVHVAEKMKAAWFKDPDGNIHALVGE
jgi:extradiol dioxygenase family protein